LNADRPDAAAVPRRGAPGRHATRHLARVPPRPGRLLDDRPRAAANTSLGPSRTALSSKPMLFQEDDECRSST